MDCLRRCRARRGTCRIHLLSIETLETKQIPISPKCVGEGLPAFSHNGEYLAYWCFLGENGAAVLYSVPIRGGQPKTISPFLAFPNGLTWSADDKKLIYSRYTTGNGNLTSELGEVTVANGLTKQLAFAGSAMQPTVSSRGDKLAYSSLSTSLNIWRRDLLHPESPAVELMPSSRAQFDAQYSPDGKRIAFASLRSGMEGVWISADDGSNLVQISNPHDQSGSPQWSPDGTKIAFDSRPRGHWEISVADVAERKPRKLVTNISDLIRPHWSRDGKWIYFRSEEPGRMGVYRCPASGGDAIALSPDTEGQSAGVFRWEDSVFCKHLYETNAEESVSAGRAGYGVRSGWIASREPRRPLEPLFRRNLFCFGRGAQIAPLL